MSEAVADLHPSLLWQHFAAIHALPRTVRAESNLAQYVSDIAMRAGCSVQRSRNGTIVIRCQASAGLEDAPSICLQGHLDVASDRSASLPSESAGALALLQLEGEFIRAINAGLGVERSLAIAAMLALIEDRELPHGPLEFLLTLEEGILPPAAKNNEFQNFASRMLLNLDSEEEGSLAIGCVGGRDTTARWKPLWEELTDKVPSGPLVIKGLRGGHAGLDIDKYRANAIKLLTRILLPLHDRGVRIGSLQGGTQRTAIPREAEAFLYVPPKRLHEIQDFIANISATIREEWAASDPEMSIEFQLETARKGKVFKRVQIRRILHVINAAPQGVMRMSPDQPHLVQTSSHIAQLSSARKHITLVTSQRSALTSELEATVSSMVSLFDIGGAHIEHSAGYPVWKPNPDSELIQLAAQTFERVYHRKPDLHLLHAGLATSTVNEQLYGMDMVAFGPQVQDAHSGTERLNIPSVTRYWNYLEALVRGVGRQPQAQLH